MGALLLTLILAAEPALQRSLEAAIAVPGARVELLAWKAPNCRGAYEASAIDSSGRVPVRVRGARCDDWGWATVRLTLAAAVLNEDVRSGEALAGRWTMREVEVRRGFILLRTIEPTATATRGLRAGQPIGPEAIRVGPAPGAPVTVRIVAGGIVLEQRGTAVGCTSGLSCASLPNGRRVQGRFEDGALLVTTAGGRL